MVETVNILSKYDEQIYHCTKCGLCQAVCPVFDVVKSEYSVARGKLALMRGFLSGQLEFTPKLARYMELCTGCSACQEACPSGVSSEKIFLAAKVYTAEKFGLSLPKQAIVKAFASEKALNFFSSLLHLYTITKAGYIANYAPNTIPFVEKIQLLNNQLNGSINIKLDNIHIKQDKPAFQLLYFPGCINKYVNPGVAKAVIEILKNNNCEIIIPAGQYCCGSPAKSAGALDVVRSLAEINLKLFDIEKLEKYDYLIVDCASCGSMLKSYHELFDDDLNKQEHSLLLKEKVIDINAFLTKINLEMPESKKNLTVTYHDPCHLRRSQDIYKQPREIIKNIGGIEYIEMPQADSCCGAAGSFCITNTKVSQAISNKKAQNIIQTKADIVLTSCPSCKIGITQGLLQYNKSIKIYHLVEFLHLLNSIV